MKFECKDPLNVKFFIVILPLFTVIKELLGYIRFLESLTFVILVLFVVLQSFIINEISFSNLINDYYSEIMFEGFFAK